MFMAPITPVRTAPAPVTTALRRAVGVPVLAFAGLVVLPWMLAIALLWTAMVVGQFGLQAIDYAGAVALGR